MRNTNARRSDIGEFYSLTNVVGRNLDFLEHGREFPGDEAECLAAIEKLGSLIKKIYSERTSRESEATDCDKSST